MNNSEVFYKLEQISPVEQKALDFMKKHGRKPSGTDLLKILHINLNDYIMTTKNNTIIPDHVNLKEKSCFDEGTNIELNKADRFTDMFPHMHDFFEIECILTGKCIHVVQNQSIENSAGDIVIVPPRVVHHASPGNDCITVNLKIRSSSFDKIFVNLLAADTILSAYLSKVLYSKVFRSSMTFHCGSDDYIQNLVLSMYGQQLDKKPFFNYMLEGMVITLFSYLIQNYSEKIEMSNITIVKDNRMAEIIDYINKNYMSVTLKSTAKKFFISEQYLSSIIKKETGSTFSSLLREIKMSRASTLLLTTDLKIDDVCEQSGYSDTTQFIKTFKKYYGLPPKKYRLDRQ